ncbi:Dedicator of cytokinesis protein 10 [Portunus trituberculatus]|uniref:Dedicator of cytokinesis protein 10 n=1 Tax=Portunus trituberculatus TaxID=210409 RepID=A0A5B7DYZ5_PORTR|nr:Dedicator of cytokinesis protein 10 [Portunus trituberculatus]
MFIIQVVSFFLGTDEFFLSTDFNSKHFLVGALLSELRVSLGEIAEVQRVAIGVLRDLLAKHSFDDRYLQSVSHFREQVFR